jgi:undecaprenyl-diphosphatase
MSDLDHSLFRLANGVWIGPEMDTCMVFLDRANDHGVVWLVLLGVLAGLGGRNGRWAALSGLVALVVGFAFSEALKNLVMQPRPFLALPDVRLLVSPPSSYSFPSSNVAYAFAASVGASLATRRLLGRWPIWAWAFLALAVAISYSRVYVGVHYPSDVLGGTILGLSIGWLCALIGSRAGKNEDSGRPTNPR